MSTWLLVTAFVVGCGAGSVAWLALLDRWERRAARRIIADRERDVAEWRAGSER